MEQKRNFLQHTVQDNTLLPIELEMLASIKKQISSDLGFDIINCQKYSTNVLYDLYVVAVNNKPYFLKVSVSPFVPNFWDKLCEKDFSFHPKIVSSSLGEDFNYICYEMPSGIFLSDVSKYPLNSKLRFEDAFSNALKNMHAVSCGDKDQTIEAITSFLPRESLMIHHTFPVAQVFGATKLAFKSLYTESLDDCCLCHFDLDGSNIILSNKEFKFLNFEYACHANKYLDLWLTKELLNCSDSVFNNFLSYYKVDNDKLIATKEASELFIFSYLNSKIISEYMTFGVTNHIKLRGYINKSEQYFNKIKNKLFLDETLDKTIQGFYLLWRS